MPAVIRAAPARVLGLAVLVVVLVACDSAPVQPPPTSAPTSATAPAMASDGPSPTSPPPSSTTPAEWSQPRPDVAPSALLVDWGPRRGWEQVSFPSQPELLGERTGRGWSATWTEDVSDDSVLILTWEGDAPRVEARDPVSGVWQHTIELSHNPLVVRRESAAQLIVSDRPFRSGSEGAREERLLIFGIEGEVSLEREALLPGRLGYKAYTPHSLLLSRDERYLFYVATGVRSELPGCVPAGYAAVCDRHSVIALDLERDAEVVGAHELPQGCGAPNLRPSSLSDIVIACPMNGIVRVATAEGAVTREIQAGGRAGDESDPVTRRNPVDVFLAFDTDQGVGVLYVDGAYALVDGQGEVALSRALPAGKRVLFSSPITETAEGTVVIAYRDRYFDTVASGFVVFDTRRGAIDHVVDASLGSVVPVDGRMLLAGDSGLQFVDPGTGQSEDIAPRPDLVPGSVLIR